jgi:hypothetical protein
MLRLYRRSWQSGDANRICRPRDQGRTLSFSKLGLTTEFAPKDGRIRRDHLEKSGRIQAALFPRPGLLDFIRHPSNF